MRSPAGTLVDTEAEKREILMPKPNLVNPARTIEAMAHQCVTAVIFTLCLYDTAKAFDP